MSFTKFLKDLQKIVKYNKELMYSKSDSLVSKQTVLVVLIYKGLNDNWGVNMANKKNKANISTETKISSIGMDDYLEFYSNINNQNR